MRKCLFLVSVALVLAAFAGPFMTAETTQPISDEALLHEAVEPDATSPDRSTQDVEGSLLEDDKIFLSWCSQACVDACIEEEAECKSFCNGNFQCEIQCSCDKYWCADACGCEQDPPPILC